jgi:hypothetical protein
MKLQQAVSQQKKLTLVERESDLTCCEYPWRTFEEVLDIYDAHQIPPDRFYT